MLYLTIIAAALLVTICVLSNKFRKAHRLKQLAEKSAARKIALEQLKLFVDGALASDGPERQAAKQGPTKRFYNDYLIASGITNLSADDEQAPRILKPLIHFFQDEADYKLILSELLASIAELESIPVDDPNRLWRIHNVEYNFKKRAGLFRDRLVAASGYNPFEMITLKLAYIDAILARLLPSAATSYDVYLELRGLLIQAESYVPNPYPPQWVELTAQQLANPNLADFGQAQGPSHDNLMVAGACRSLAAEALLEKDYANAKLAMAYFDAYAQIRDEVGDILIADLAKMVASLDEAQRRAVAKA